MSEAMAQKLSQPKFHRCIPSLSSSVATLEPRLNNVKLRDMFMIVCPSEDKYPKLREGGGVHEKEEESMLLVATLLCHYESGSGLSHGLCCSSLSCNQ